MITFIGGFLVFLGLFLIFSSTIGCFKFPDYFTKMHAATIGDAVGCPLVLLGIAIQSNNIIIVIKIILLIFILLIINPTASYILNNTISQTKQYNERREKCTKLVHERGAKE